MPETLLTERLELAPWSSEDAEMLVALAATPAVTRYIGDGRPWSELRARDVAASADAHWGRHGFGWRVVRERDQGPDTRPTGLIALNFAGPGAGVDPREYEIGWWLNPSVWGRGLAREGATAVRDEAFGRVGAPSIVARIQPENSASLAVAQALGLEPDGRSTGRGGEPIVVLRLTAESWRSAGAAGE
jgi:RimJ/RimL family protein N-acetyltransferase